MNSNRTMAAILCLALTVTAAHAAPGALPAPAPRGLWSAVAGLFKSPRRRRVDGAAAALRGMRGVLSARVQASRGSFAVKIEVSSDADMAAIKGVVDGYQGLDAETQVQLGRYRLYQVVHGVVLADRRIDPRMELSRVPPREIFQQSRAGLLQLPGVAAVSLSDEAATDVFGIAHQTLSIELRPDADLSVLVDALGPLRYSGLIIDAGADGATAYRIEEDGASDPRG